MELVARFHVVSVTHAPLHLLWQLVRDTAGVTRREFEAYFRGLKAGTAIQIGDVISFVEPVSLAKLRRIWGGFQPPQGFRYVTASDVARLGLGGIPSAA
jgi:predicted transcriptional regulator